MRFFPIARISFLLYCCAAVPTQLLICQDSKGVHAAGNDSNITSGKTYGLIIGISKYESFPSLKYADRDAAAFYNFLKSKAGGNIDSADIYYKTNEEAKAGNVWTGVSWLERRADSAGENAIIYFSGHGDAANAEEAYLLAYDAPNEGDPILYNTGGTCQIYNLKIKIKQMVSKGVKVILITDACRTNDLPGKGDGARWTFQSITEEKCGEIQMISCSGNEQSFEDAKWGNGRGVFSFHLLNGLMGMADNDPQNGQVTLYELERYVKDKVRMDTRPSPNDQPRQNPVFCCSEKNEVVISKVDQQIKNNSGNAYVPKKANLFIIGKQTKSDILNTLKSYKAGVGETAVLKKSDLFRDSVFENIYRLFSQAISKKELIEPKGKSATDYLNQLLPLVKDTVTKEDLQDQLMGALINEAQASMNRYTRPPILDTTDILNFTVFNTGSLLLNEALKYATKNKTLAKEINARKLVLEARALVEIGGDTSIALTKIDSSLAFMTTSYGYHTKGLLLLQMNKDAEALQYFEKATGQNRKWAYPVVAEGDLFRSRGKYDSAIVYYRRALGINPNNDNNAFKMGIALQENGQYDSSIVYFQKALNTRNKTLGKENYNYANCLNYLAKSYDRKGNNSTAESLYKEAINICKKIPGREHLYYANTLNNLAGLYEKTGKQAAAKPLYTQASVIKQNISVTNVNVGPRHQPEINRQNPAIGPGEMAMLLQEVASGKKNAADLAPYLCRNLSITVKFNYRTTTFEKMCKELKEINNTTEINNPEVELIRNPETHCITSMRVTVTRKRKVENNSGQQPSVPTDKTNRNASDIKPDVSTQHRQPDVKNPDRVTPAQLSELVKAVESGKRDVCEFADYLCKGVGTMVQFNEKTMTFEKMCSELKEAKKTTEINNPGIELIKDAQTNCITSMQVTVTRKTKINNTINQQPSQPAGKTGKQDILRHKKRTKTG